jgi:hypothetical protein
MEKTLGAFLTASNRSPSDFEAKSKKARKEAKVEGVWIKSRQSSINSVSSPSPPPSEREDDGALDEREDEEGEMVWWSWDGKLVGFSEW